MLYDLATLSYSFSVRIGRLCELWHTPYREELYYEEY